MHIFFQAKNMHLILFYTAAFKASVPQSADRGFHSTFLQIHYCTHLLLHLSLLDHVVFSSTAFRTDTLWWLSSNKAFNFLLEPNYTLPVASTDNIKNHCPQNGFKFVKLFVYPFTPQVHVTSI